MSPVNSSIRNVKRWCGSGKTERRNTKTCHKDVTQRRHATAVQRSAHDHRSAQRDQDGREPRGAGAGGGRGDGGRWALRGGGARGGEPGRGSPPTRIRRGRPRGGPSRPPAGPTPEG